MIRFLLAVFSLLASWAAHAQPPAQPQMFGALEHWTYDQAARQIKLRGWVLAGKDGSTFPALTLTVFGTESPARDVAWAMRPDVSVASSVTGDQIGRGFEFAVTLPKALPAGVHPIRLDANFLNGTHATLLSVSDGPPQLVVKKVPSRHWRLLVITLAVVLVIQFSKVGRGEKWAKARILTNGKGAYLAVAGAFCVLVAAGVTGSSLGVVLQSPLGQRVMEVQGSQEKLFGLRLVRGDEWGVLMPNALAQIHHDPQFPVVNSHVGLGGQNMGVIGMTGVPIRQWAALARPATWGYFFLPLRQAMSWQWQLPFWGCLLAVWCMLNVIRPSQRGLNMALSFAFCVAPYAAAWSNWPLYATMFPALAFVLICKMLTVRRCWQVVLLGLALGWALACWFLVLYPTWLIIVGSLLAFVWLGWCIDRRAQLHWGMAHVCGVVLAGVVVAVLLGSWWMDTRDAVALIQATVYPGGRGALQGGDLSWWWYLRGYNNAEVVAHMAGPATNQSEASSYFLLPLLLITLAVLHMGRPSVRRWSISACALFMAFYWFYCFVGVPLWLAKYSLWGNMPTGRMDVGVGLASTILIALTADLRTSGERSSEHSFKALFLPGLVALGSAIIIVWILRETPPAFMPIGNAIYFTATAAAGAFVCWWMLRGRVVAAVAMMLVMHLSTSLSFNPISRAPESVALSDGHRRYVSDPKDETRLLRTLVVNGDGIGPMMFAAVGIPTANGVLYYPHEAFWKRMGLPEASWVTVNRYQHLGFYLIPSVTEPDGYSVTAASIDQVHVHVNPQRFDFSRTGAERVAALPDQATALMGNPSLIFLGQFKGLHWFAVQHLGAGAYVQPR